VIKFEPASADHKTNTPERAKSFTLTDEPRLLSDRNHVSDVAAAPRSNPLLGRSAAVAFLALAAAAIVCQASYRSAEIWVAGQLARLVSSHAVVIDAANQTYYFNVDTPRVVGLTMTPECTSAFLVLPLLLVAAAFALLRPTLARKVAVAVVVSAIAVIVVNQIRLLTMIGLMNWLGNETGYYWGHTLLGSIVSIIGGAGALVLFVVLTVRKTKSERQTLAAAEESE
jgi:exosortase/archaeosortase family protein